MAGLPWRAGAGARRHGGLVRRRFALPLLYAERARGGAGGLMGGAAPRAAVRQAAPVTAGGGSSAGWSGLGAALSTQRDSGGCRVVARGGTLRWRDACPGGRRVRARSVKCCSLTPSYPRGAADGRCRQKEGSGAACAPQRVCERRCRYRA